MDELTAAEELALRQRNAQLDKGKRKHANDPTPSEPKRAQRTRKGAGSFVGFRRDAYTPSHPRLPRRDPEHSNSPLDLTISPTPSIIFGSPTLDEMHAKSSTAGSTPGDEEIIFVESKNSHSNHSDARPNRSRGRQEVEIVDTSSMTIHDGGPPPQHPFPKSSIDLNPRPLALPPRVPRRPPIFVLPADEVATKEYRAGTEFCDNLSKSLRTRQAVEKLRHFPLEPRPDPSNCIVRDACGEVVLEDFVDYRRSRKDHPFCLRRRAGVQETLDGMPLADVPQEGVSKLFHRSGTKASIGEDWGFLPEEKLVWGAEPWWNSNAWELYERLRGEMKEEEGILMNKLSKDLDRRMELEITLVLPFDITSIEGRFLAWSKEPSTIARNERSRLRQEKRKEEARQARGGIVHDVDVEI